MDHWKEKKILKYIRYTLDYRLHYTGYLAILKGYSDANWLSDTMDLKFANEYVFTLDGAAVSWKSSKKTYITIFTMVQDLLLLIKQESCKLSGFEISYRCSILAKPLSIMYVHYDCKSTIRKA